MSRKSAKIQTNKAQDRGARLVMAMQMRGAYKQHALAHALGVNESNITRWKANGPMTIEHAVALCRELDISLDWFLTGNGSSEQHRARIDAKSILNDELISACLQAATLISDDSKALLLSFMRSVLSP